MARIHLIGWRNQAGLSRDLALLSDVLLTSGHEVRIDGLTEVEGFGHPVLEGMNLGAVVLTTDAPPMNELITPERGVLVPVARSESMRRGTRYQVDAEALEATLDHLLGTSEARLDQLGRAATRWFEENDRGFRDRLRAAVSGILCGRNPAGPAR